MQSRILGKVVATIAIALILTTTYIVVTPTQMSGEQETPTPPSPTFIPSDANLAVACTGSARDEVLAWYEIIGNLGDLYPIDSSYLDLATESDLDIPMEDMATLRTHAEYARDFLNALIALSPPELAWWVHEAGIAWLMAEVTMWDLHVAYAEYVQQGQNPVALEPVLDIARDVNDEASESATHELEALEAGCWLSDDTVVSTPT
jgi:hypothetical protein